MATAATANGWRATATRPAAPPSYEYTGGALTKITTPGGRITLIAYYPSTSANAGKVHTLTRVTDRQALTGDVWTFTYDQDRDGSSTATVTDARENDTEYEFDTRGRAKKITDAFERERSLQYSSNDNVTDYWSPANSAASSPTSPTTKFSYDTGTGLPGGSETEVGEDSVLTTATTYGGQQSGGGAVGSSRRGVPALIDAQRARHRGADAERPGPARHQL